MNAVIYAKYYGSKDLHNNFLNSLSIEEQIAMCKQYAEDNNLNVIAVYKDSAMSGNEENRQDFKKMLEDSKNKEFQIVLVSSYDRFAISRYDSVTYKEKLRKNGVKVNSVKEPVPNNVNGILIETMIESLTEYFYLKQIAK